MRKIFMILALGAAAALQGCSDRRVREAADVADSFITAFFAADYDKAAALCSDSMRARVDESAASVDAISDSLEKAAFLELSAELEIHAGEIYEMGQDSVIVDFDIMVPDELEPMRNSVVVVLDKAADVWKVVGMR
ncbi:MAG TPA: hypothetical protein IAC03_07410 [Candidatus Coprenecus pullistercoris]|nr:hypothetical protein [Candidatus Coprenecus pullistercoris]